MTASSMGRTRGPGRAKATALALALCAATGGAVAATSDVSATGFVASFRQEVKAPPARVFEAMGHIERWWNPAHTYSGDASHLSMPLEAGACFCERWDDGAVMHGRVVMVMRDRVVRVDGAFGPLQALGATGILTLALKVVDGRTVLEASYRVGGPPSAGLDALAPAVDGVIGEQVKRLVSVVETGGP